MMASLKWEKNFEARSKSFCIDKQFFVACGFFQQWGGLGFQARVGFDLFFNPFYGGIDLGNVLVIGTHSCWVPSSR